MIINNNNNNNNNKLMMTMMIMIVISTWLNAVAVSYTSLFKRNDVISRFLFASNFSYKTFSNWHHGIMFSGKKNSDPTLFQGLLVQNRNRVQDSN